MLAAEFLSDDDNSENNIDNTMYNQEQNLSMNQLAQLNSNMGFQQVQNHHQEHLQDQEKVISVFVCLFGVFFVLFCVYVWVFLFTHEPIQKSATE